MLFIYYSRGGVFMARYSSMLGEYTEDEQVYHFGCRGKCYYITLKDKEGVEQSVY